MDELKVIRRMTNFLGVDLAPETIDFSLDHLSLVHMGIGFGLANLPPIVALSGSLLFVGYQLSQVSESMSSTSTEIFELGAGMILGYILGKRR